MCGYFTASKSSICRHCEKNASSRICHCLNKTSWSTPREKSSHSLELARYSKGFCRGIFFSGAPVENIPEIRRTCYKKTEHHRSSSIHHQTLSSSISIKSNTVSLHLLTTWTMVTTTTILDQQLLNQCNDHGNTNNLIVNCYSLFISIIIHINSDLLFISIIIHIR